jgi:hypothetical protein
MITDKVLGVLREKMPRDPVVLERSMSIRGKTLLALIERLDAAERVIELADEETSYPLLLAALRAWQRTTGRVSEPKPLDWCIADTITAMPPEVDA